MTSKTTYDQICDVCGIETKEVMFDDDEVDYTTTWISLGFYEARGDKKKHMFLDLCSVDCLNQFIHMGGVDGKLTREQAETCSKHGKVPGMQSSSSLFDDA